MENAVIYARYSSHSQTEQSIEGQLAQGRNYAAIKGYNVIHEYCDRAKTGTNDNREEFQQMLRDTAKHKFSVIIVWKVDRFGRNREEITFNKYQCKKNGVRIEYVAETISEGPEGVILESVLEGMAEYYSLQLSQNIKRGQLESAKKHLHYGGSIPFGYYVDKNKEYQLHQTNSKVVRQIFEEYAAGKSMAQITDWLNINGYRTVRGTLFTKNSLPRLLHNEMYRGVYKYKDAIYDENAVPRIVSDELFAEVQSMLDKNKVASSRWSTDYYFLTGKLFCTECGAAMNGKSGQSAHSGKYRYYACSKCNRRYRADQLEEFVTEHLNEIIQSEDTLEHITDIVWEYYQTHDRENDDIEQLQKQISTCSRGIENLTKAVEQGMPYEAVKNRLEELAVEKTNLERELGERELKRGYMLTRDKIKFFLTQFKTFDEKSKERLLNTLVNSIHVSESEISIALNYSEEHSLPSCVQVELSKHQENLFIMKGTIVIRWKKEDTL